MSPVSPLAALLAAALVLTLWAPTVALDTVAPAARVAGLPAPAPA